MNTARQSLATMANPGSPRWMTSLPARPLQSRNRPLPLYGQRGWHDVTCRQPVINLQARLVDRLTVFAQMPVCSATILTASIKGTFCPFDFSPPRLPPFEITPRQHPPESHRIDSGAFWPPRRRIVCPGVHQRQWGNFGPLAVVGVNNDQGVGSNGPYRHKPTPLNPNHYSALSVRTREVKAYLLCCRDCSG